MSTLNAVSHIKTLSRRITSEELEHQKLGPKLREMLRDQPNLSLETAIDRVADTILSKISEEFAQDTTIQNFQKQHPSIQHLERSHLAEIRYRIKQEIQAFSDVEGLKFQEKSEPEAPGFWTTLLVIGGLAALFFSSLVKIDFPSSVNSAQESGTKESKKACKGTKKT